MFDVIARKLNSPRTAEPLSYLLLVCHSETLIIEKTRSSDRHNFCQKLRVTESSQVGMAETVSSYILFEK